MKNYRLIYEQPYEFDEDSPSGVGDHDIAYSRYTYEFEASDVPDARKQAHEHLEGRGLNFGYHIGSPSAGYYPCRVISLAEFEPEKQRIIPLNR